MRKTFTVVLLAAMAVMMFAPMAFASEGGASEAQLSYYAMAVLGCGLAIGLAALGTGIGMGLGIGRACEGVARNPGVSNKIMTTMIVGLALVESLAIYALVVVLIVFFVNPFGI
ncbi:MAG: ATP synthase F0 subunit C [Thermodesulfovibrionales bacterium]|nr:ATP synthase F0 subunit C [Thermodesulfovibrionales bacterium]